MSKKCIGVLGLFLIFSLGFTPIFATLDLEPVTMSDSSLKNSFGSPIIDNININQHIQISTDIKNNQEKSQDFIYLVQIKNKESTVVSLGWISGQLAPDHTLNPSLSWTPNEVGEFTAEIFVWENLKNNGALGENTALQIHVS
jgi:hypothetical protein